MVLTKMMKKEEGNQPIVTFGTNSFETSNPSNNNAPSVNQQFPSVLPWLYAPLIDVDQPSSWSQSQLPHLAQPSMPFCAPQHHGSHLPRMNAPALFPSFAPITTIGFHQPASGFVRGGTSSTDRPVVPDLCFQSGFAYPGFIGPWDPSSWWGQSHSSQPNGSYTYPGSYGYSSVQPVTLPGFQAPLGEASQRGIIRPSAELSRQHQQQWEAQSAENVQLRTLIGQLGSEIGAHKSRIEKLEAAHKSRIEKLEAAHKSRIEKLEADVSSLKRATEVPVALATGTAVCQQPWKRERPRKTVDLDDVLLSSNVAFPALARVSEKVILSEAENNVKPSNQTAISQKKQEKVATVMANNNNDIVALSFCSHQETRMQPCSTGIDSSLEMKINDDKTGGTNCAFAVSTRQAEGNHQCPASASCLAAENNKHNEWYHTITSESNSRNALNTGMHTVKESRQVVPGSGYVSEELDDMVAASAKVENDPELEDDDGGSASGGEANFFLNTRLELAQNVVWEHAF